MFSLCAACASSYREQVAPAPADAGVDAPLDVVDANVGRKKSLSISMGDQSACVLREGNEVLCWGSNTGGQLGLAPNGGSSSPVRVIVPTTDNLTDVVVGSAVACVRTDRRDVYCWGSNADGIINGQPTPAHAEIPQRIDLPPVEELAIGRANACVRVATTPSRVYCWGRAADGILGADAMMLGGVRAPIELPALSGAKHIALGLEGATACAILASDDVFCWGANRNGVLGHKEAIGPDQACPSTFCNPTPQRIGDASFRASAIGVGYFGACVVGLGDNLVRCWGYNAEGALGTSVADQGDHPSPVIAPTSGAVDELSYRTRHVCVRISSTIECWGADSWGELGTGRTSAPCAETPFRCRAFSARVASDLVVRRISAGGSASLVEATNGDLFAWGANIDGRLGHPPRTNGDRVDCSQGDNEVCHPLPSPIVLPP
jgi:alpha-tubulin suppressor-like RCC1 family protein